MNARRRPVRSDQRPATNLSTAAVASARPSSQASDTALAPSVIVRNAGSNGTTISLAASVNRLTNPIATTRRLSQPRRPAASLLCSFNPNSAASRPARDAGGPAGRSDLDLRFISIRASRHPSVIDPSGSWHEMDMRLRLPLTSLLCLPLLACGHDDQDPSQSETTDNMASGCTGSLSGEAETGEAEGDGDPTGDPGDGDGDPGDGDP